MQAKKKYPPRADIALALNSGGGDVVASALCRELALSEGGDVPDRIELIPPGPEFKGSDGRAFSINAKAVLAEFVKGGKDLPLDIEHATELRAREGLPAPAVGWITGLEIEANGSIWGMVSWNADGRAAVANRSYRYVSPVFGIVPGDKSAPMKVKRLTSVGLTNSPNLRLQALNSETTKKETNQMDELAEFLAALRTALGLSDDASQEAVLEAVATAAANKPDATETNRALPDMTLFVPKATHELALNRAQRAETELAARDKSEHDTAINSAVDTAIADGKIAPANRDHYVALCQSENGLTTFTDMMKSAPAVVPLGERATGKPKGDTASNALTDEEREVCRQFGVSEENYIKQREADAKEVA